ASHPSLSFFDAAGNLYGISAGGTYGYGVVFKLTPSGGGWSFSIVHAFDGTESTYPNSLLMGKDGNLYGAGNSGGKYGYGTVFELTPSGGGWSETILYSFQDLSDGEGPGDLVQDASGNFFGLTQDGLGDGGETFFMLSPSDEGWVLTPLFTTQYYQQGLVFGMVMAGNHAQGITAGPACFGPSCVQQQYSYGQIFELTPGNGGGNYQVLHTFYWWSPHYVTVAPNGYTLWGTSPW